MLRLADAQLVIAREYGFTSWPRLVRYFEGVERGADLPALQAIVDAHPELLAQSEYEMATRVHLLAWAVDRGREAQAQGEDRNGMRPIIDWLASKGFDVQRGLGDIEAVARFFDRNGRPTDAARQHRVQFDALGTHALPQAPDDDDDEILLEAAMVAFLNERTTVLEYLVARGFPIDTLRWDMAFVVMAVGNAKVGLVESLVRCGANLDLRGAVNGAAREMAQRIAREPAAQPDRRCIAELCGLDVDTR